MINRSHKRSSQIAVSTTALFLTSIIYIQVLAADYSDEQRDAIKQELMAAIDDKAKLAQIMNDMIFSFGELGFQEFETSNYLTTMLSDNGFEVAQGISGIPTAWMASWGEGEPVIALGSDIDGIPKASQNQVLHTEIQLSKGRRAMVRVTTQAKS
jgi:aminobenzoyl-glutamate utilization protein B